MSKRIKIVRSMATDLEAGVDGEYEVQVTLHVEAASHGQALKIVESKLGESDGDE